MIIGRKTTHEFSIFYRNFAFYICKDPDNMVTF